MIKILFTTPELAHPPASGPTLRIENSIKALSRTSELHLLARVGQARMGGIEAETFYRSLSAGFAYTPSANGGPPTNAGVWQDATAIINYAESHDIDIVWFGFGNISYELMKAVKSLNPHLKIICDTDSVWSRFVLRELPFEKSLERRRWIEHEGHQKMLQEADWVNFCNVTTAVSEVDAEYYKGLSADPARIKIFSNVIDLDMYSYQNPPNDFKKPCMYLAGTFYAPTSPMVRSARWVMDEIFSKVRNAMPDIHFYIVGNGSKMYLPNLQSSNVSVVGKVKSVLPYLCNADVALVPLMFESGTRFKIMEAGACNIPIVSTTLGAEGIPITHGKDILIADTAEAFTDTVIRVINDKVLAKQLALNCRTLIEHRYSVEQLCHEATCILQYLHDH